MEPFTLLLLIIITIPIISYLIPKKTSKIQTTVPSPPGAWPVIGHLHMLAGKSPPHLVLAAISDRYGPIIALRLGMKATVIVSGLEAMKECFTTKDHLVSSRPECSLGRIMGHENACFGLAPNGPYWRKLRKVCVTELLCMPKIEHFVALRTSEVGEFVKDIYKYSQRSSSSDLVVVNMAQWFCHLVINIILRMVATKRYPYPKEGEDAERVIGVVREFMTAAGLTAVSDMIPIPIIREMLDLQGNLKAMKKATGNLDPIVEGWINERREKRATLKNSPNPNYIDEDFIDALLSQVGKGELKFDQFETQTTIISTIEAIFLAATDSTCAGLMWTISLLINHPHVLQQAQEELNRVVGSERWVEESDIPNLPLLQAITKESLRLHPPAPLGAPHEASEDCSISGYPIRKGTQIFFNFWKLQRDPRVWPDPDAFKPERFLPGGSMAGADVRSGKSYEILPFGSGRRICPAPETAMRMLYLTLARMIQGFGLDTPDGGPVDMTEGPGIIAPTASPLQLVLTPRLPHVMYQ